MTDWFNENGPRLARGEFALNLVYSNCLIIIWFTQNTNSSFELCLMNARIRIFWLHQLIISTYSSLFMWIAIIKFRIMIGSMWGPEQQLVFSYVLVATTQNDCLLFDERSKIQIINNLKCRIILDGTNQSKQESKKINQNMNN